MEIIVGYYKKEGDTADKFYAVGDAKSTSKIHLDGRNNSNLNTMINCKNHFNCEPTINYIIPLDVIKDIIIRLANDYIRAAITYQAYQEHMTSLFTALGASADVAAELYKTIQSFYNNGKPDNNHLDATVKSLEEVIKTSAEFESNMMYGYPKISELVDRRLNFPLADVKYKYLNVGTVVKDSIGSEPHETSDIIQVAYVTGNSRKRLDALLHTPIREGDVTVALTGLSGSIKGEWDLHMVSSQHFALEHEIRVKSSGLKLPFPNAYFAHEIKEGQWLLFKRTDMGSYTIYTANP